MLGGMSDRIAVRRRTFGGRAVTIPTTAAAARRPARRRHQLPPRAGSTQTARQVGAPPAYRNSARSTAGRQAATMARGVAGAGRTVRRRRRRPPSPGSLATALRAGAPPARVSSTAGRRAATMAQPDRGDVVFNKCEYQAPYSTLLQEAGHALGIRGGSSSDDDFKGHPTIPGSVMNYDHRIKDAEDQHGITWTSFSEPDCSPHPFDILAIFSAYQSMIPPEEY